MSDYKPNPQMVAFYEMEILPLLKSLRSGGYYLSLPKIQEQYNKSMHIIERRYGSVNIELCDTVPVDSMEGGLLLFGCRIDGSKPFITICIQQLQILFYEFMARRRYDFRECFENTVIIGLMHEMHHIELERVGSKEDIEKTIDDERVVWGFTCENAMRLLVDACCRELLDSDYQIYSMWIQCGRDAESQQWKDFIAGIYRKIKRN